MAYNKHTWQCGEPITIGKLNHMENGIANAGGGDCGYECEESRDLLTNETLTAVQDGDTAFAEFSYSQFIDASSITVTFNGTEYTCNKFVVEGENCYGGVGQYGPDFSVYPFFINSTPYDANYLITETAGTYTVKIEVVETTVTTTPCFDVARGYSCDGTWSLLVQEAVTTVEGDGVIGEFDYDVPITAEAIKVTFDGTEYECPRIQIPGANVYAYGGIGADEFFDFSEYPFAILSGEVGLSGVNNLFTETAGTYNVKIEKWVDLITATPCFKKAVQSSLGENTVYAHMRSRTDGVCMIYTLDITDADLANIIANNQQLVVIGDGLVPTYYFPVRMRYGGDDSSEQQRSVGGVNAELTLAMYDHHNRNTLISFETHAGTTPPRYLTARSCPQDSCCDPLVIAYWGEYTCPGVASKGSNTKDANTVSQYSFTYDDMLEAMDSNRRVMIWDNGVQMEVLTKDATYDNGVYSVQATYIDVHGDIQTLRTFSDTADVYMVDYNCWSNATNAV